MELCREILVALEQAPFANSFSRLEIPGYSQEQVYYHIRLLYTAGLIDAINQSVQEGPRWIAQNMTMAGHDFLEMARNNTNWNKAKTFIAEKGQTLTLEALKVVLISITKLALGIGV
jgi:DNA-binding transcriptional ArsR family regulator